MAGLGDFRYVITTELRLETGATQLIQQIADLDKQVKAHFNSGQGAIGIDINVGARLNNLAKQKIQREVGEIKTTVKVGLELDRASKLKFDADIQKLNTEIRQLLTSTNVVELRNLVNGGTTRNGMPQVGTARTQNQANIILTEAKARDLLSKSILREAQARKIDRQEALDQIKVQQAQLRLEQARTAIEARKQRSLTAQAKPNNIQNQIAVVTSQLEKAQQRLNELWKDTSGLDNVAKKMERQREIIRQNELELERLNALMEKVNRTGMSKVGTTSKSGALGYAVSLPANHPSVIQNRELLRQQQQRDREFERRHAKNVNFRQQYNVPDEFTGSINDWKQQQKDAYYQNRQVDRQRAERARLQRQINGTQLGASVSLNRNHPVIQHLRAQQPKDVRDLLMSGTLSPAQASAEIDKEIARLKAIAKESGKSVSTTFHFKTMNADGTVSTVKTVNTTITALGETIRHGEQTFDQYIEKITKGFLAHHLLLGSIYGIVRGFDEAIKSAMEFQSEMAKIQATSTNLATGQTRQGYGQFTNSQVMQDVYGISQRYGFNADKNILPAYTSAVRRESTKDYAKDYADVITQAVALTKGPEASEEDFKKISESILSMPEIMKNNPDWQGKGGLNQTKRIMDTIAGMYPLGADSEKTLEATTELAPFGAQMGLDPNQIAKYVGSYTTLDSSQSGSEIATTFRRVFGNMLRPGGKALNLSREQLGLIGYDQNGTTPDLNVPIEVLQKWWESQSELDKQNGGDAGKRRQQQLAQGFVSSTGNGMSNLPMAYNAIQSIVEGSKQGTTTGDADKLSSLLTDQLQSNVQRLSSAFEHLGVSLVNGGAGQLLNGLVTGLTSLINGISNTIDKVNALGQQFTVFGLNLVHAGEAVLTFVTALKTADLVLGLLPNMKGETVKSLTTKGIDVTKSAGKKLVSDNRTYGPLTKGDMAKSAIFEIGNGIIGTYIVGGINKVLGFFGKALLSGGVTGALKNLVGNVFSGTLGNVIKGLMSFGNVLTRVVGLFTGGALGAILGTTLAVGAVGYGVYKWGSNKLAENDRHGADMLAGDLADGRKRAEIQSKLSEINSLRAQQGSFTGYADPRRKRLNQLTSELNQSYGINPDQGNNFTYYGYDKDGNLVKKTFDVRKGADGIQVHDTTNQSSKKYNPDNFVGQENLKSLLAVSEYNSGLTSQQASLAQGQISSANALHSLNYLGATDTTGYMTGAFNIAQQGLAQNMGFFNQYAQQRSNLAGVMVDQNTMNGYASQLDNNQIKDVQRKWALAQADGTDINTFLGGLQDDKVKQYAHAYAINSTVAPKVNDLTDKMNQLNNASIQFLQTMKDLTAKFVEATTGAKLFEGVLRVAETNSAHSQAMIGLSSSLEGRIGATQTSMGSLSTQYAVQNGEYNNVLGVMGAMRGQYGADNFSMDKLYSSTNALTPEQTAYKDLLEKSQQLQGSIDSTTTAIRQQADSLVDLVMQTDKYRVMWDSVNSSIDTAKQVQESLRTQQYAPMINAQMSLVHGINGPVDKSNFDIQSAQQFTQTAMSNYESAMKAISTYKDDSAKLSEALSEVGKSNSDIERDKVVNPLKDIVNTDFKGAVADQSKALKDFGNQMSSFQKAVADFQKAVSAMPNNNATTSTTDNATTTIPTKGTNPSDIAKGTPSGTFHAIMNGIASANAPAGSRTPVDAKTDEYGNPIGDVSAVSNNHTGDASYWTKDKIEQLFQEKGKASGYDPKFLEAISIQESGMHAVDAKPGRNYDKNGNLKSTDWGLMQINDKDGNWDTSKLQSDPNYNVDASIQTLNDKKAWLQRHGYEVNATNLAHAYNGWIDGVHSNYADSVSSIYSQLTDGKDPVAVAGNKGTETQTKQKQAEDQNVKSTYQSTLDMLTGKIMEMQANNKGISTTMNQSIYSANLKSSIDGSMLESITGYYDAIKQARQSAGEQLLNNRNSLQGLYDLRDQKMAQLQSTPATDTETVKALNETIKALNEKIPDVEQAVRDNEASLNSLNDQLQQSQYNDPTWNGDNANKKFGQYQDQINQLVANGEQGDPLYLKTVSDYNSAYSQFATRQKSVDTYSQYFKNTGDGYGELATNEQALFNETLNKTWKQFDAINTVLKGIQEGTNNWFTILSDAVKVEQQLDQMENDKLDKSKQWFEMTNQGLGAYINSRAVVQSRDFTRAYSNLGSTLSNAGQGDYNEQLANFQAIGDAHNKMISIMDDYRKAIVDAYKAGAMSLDDYMQKLTSLRDLQTEAKTQAVNMTSGMQSSFQNAFSSALSSRLKGNYDAPFQFTSDIRSSLADQVSQQMSNIVIQNSGINDTINNLISNMTQSMTSGDPNKDVNAFNFNSFTQALNNQVNQITPYLDQIAQSTKGIFGALTDTTFNAPQGMKIDSYLYDVAKGKNVKDITGFDLSTGTNRTYAMTPAGSPIPTDSNGNPLINVPLGKVNSANPTQDLNKQTPPIQSVREYQPSSGTTTVTTNQVKDLLDQLIIVKNQYNSNLGPNDQGNELANAEATKIRNMISAIAPDIGKQIGTDNNTNSKMTVDQLKQLENSSKVSSYNQTKSVDNVDNSVQDMSQTLSGQLGNLSGDNRTLGNVFATGVIGIVSEVSKVVSAIQGLRGGGSSSQSNSTASSSISSSTTSTTVDDFNNQLSYLNGLGSDWGNQQVTAIQNMGQTEYDFLMAKLRGGGGNAEWAKSQLDNAGIAYSSNDVGTQLQQQTNYLDDTSKNTSDAVKGIDQIASNTTGLGNALTSNTANLNQILNGIVNSSSSSNHSSSSSSYTSSMSGFNPSTGKPIAGQTTQGGITMTSTANGTGWVHTHHTGGLAGMSSFKNPLNLTTDEVNAILQQGEYVFQPKQVASLINQTNERAIGGLFSSLPSFGSSSSSVNGNMYQSSSDKLTVEVNINGNGSGVDQESLQSAVAQAVENAVTKMQKKQRFNNLQIKGVSY